MGSLQMYNFIEIKEKVKKYYIINSTSGLYQFSDYCLSINNNVLSQNVLDFIEFNGNVIIEKEEQLQVVDFSNNALATFKGKFNLFKAFKTKNELYIKCEENDEDFLVKLTRHNEIIKLAWYDRFRYKLFGENMFCIKGKIAYIKNLNSGDEVWNLSLSSLLNSDNANLHGDILEYKGKLFFYVSGAEGQRTFCVDIATGKVLHEYPELQYYSKIEGDNLYNFFMEKVTILHIPTNAMQVYDIEDILVANGIERVHYGRWFVNDGLIYLIQNKGADKNYPDKGAMVAIVNPKENKFIWKYSLPATCGMIGNIQLNHNRLYAHTQDDSLCIFEKESLGEV
jgi:hypothetical protein